VRTLIVLTLAGAAAMVTMVGTGWLVRRRFRRLEGSFRCRLRRTDDGVLMLSRWRLRRILWSWFGDWARAWPGVNAWGVWAHDVLLVHRGLWRPRIAVFRVRFPDGPMMLMSDVEVTGLGPNPMVFPLRCDDEKQLEVAAAEEDRTLLAGPFLAAAIPGLPKAPRERRVWDT